MKILQDILTGIDNKTYDNGRVICFLSYLVYFFMAVYSTLKCHPWNPTDFCAGAGAMAVGFGINLKLKSDTEPK
jgi:hypothetical protein